jgi:tricorn protease
MLHVRVFTIGILSVFALAGQAQAQEPIRFARTPDISPDGKLVAFSYLGDIWVVEAIGGVARPVTMHEKHDIYPVFSPDAKKIAFSSNRHGSYDVFVVGVQGGKPNRLTFDSADDLVSGWSPDGKSILFTSARDLSFPTNNELYTVPVAGGRATRITAFEGRDGVFSPDGDLIAYVRGPGDAYRKYYHGSSNDDIWICDADGKNNRRLTSHAGQDTSPMWSPDRKTIYYVSDVAGPPGSPANIVRQEVAVSAHGPLAVIGPPQPITFHRDEGVRRARLSAGGEWIVYECGADLWIVSTTGGSSRLIPIEVNADDKTNPDRIVTYTSGISEFAVSGDDYSIAVVLHGEIFGMPRTGGKAKCLTNSPANDHSPVWSSDGSKLIFLSDRGGHEDIWLLQSADPATKTIVKTSSYKLTQLTKGPEGAQGLNLSPDGKTVSFIRSGKLLTMSLDGTGLKEIVSKPRVIDYEWSPDSRWIAYARLDGNMASEIYIIPASGPTDQNPARNVTRYATFNAGITWSRNGRLAFLSERRAQSPLGICVMALQRPSVQTGAVPKVASDIDWDDIHLRVFQPTTMQAEEAAISNDGKYIAFRSKQNGDDLWIATTDGKEVTRVTNTNLRPSQLTWSRSTFTNLLYFLDASGNLRMYVAASSAPASASPTLSGPMPFQAKLVIKRDEEFAEMFEQSWRALDENFYDASFHGANWIAIREKYLPLVKHVALREDFFDLVNMMLGELNASHLGIIGMPTPAEQPTADLGLLFDSSYKGPGLKVAEILKRGPADKRGLNVKAGDVILSIDHVPVSANVDPAKALNDKINDTVSCEVTSNPADPKATRTVELLAVSRGVIRPLMYDRWVAANAKKVSELSGGRLGYIHIRSMDDDGLDRFVRSLYSDNFDKDAIVLDVRFNGGGNTHDKVLNYLGGKEHTIFAQRNGGIGPVMAASDRKWNKPLVLLINNRSYSDAEIFPHAFRTLGLGKLVGQPTGGFVIGTTSSRLIDGSIFRVPRTGIFTLKGVNMEKEGVMPDLLVETDPDQWARGDDQQLVKAIHQLSADVAALKGKGAWSMTNPWVGGFAWPGLAPAPAAPPAPVQTPMTTSKNER